MLRLPKIPAFWFGLFAIWIGLLWFLSSRSGDLQDMPTFPHSDKVAHLIYFGAGGATLAAALFSLRPAEPRWMKIIVITVIVIAIVGAGDEFHQSFVPGRSGNDPFDWLADITGGLLGSLAVKRLQKRLFA